MNGFANRASRHDNEALPLVIESFAKYDFGCQIMGTETDNPQARAALTSQSDKTSIMLRYRPDRFFTQKGNRSVLCEVKSEYQGRPNFAIEFDSFIGTKQWNASGRHVMYALVDLTKNTICCCWAGDIPAPESVLVPKREWDYEDTLARLTRENPEINFISKSFSNGSGTAFFLLSKSHKCLKPFDAFVENELIPAQQWTPETVQQLDLFKDYYYRQGM